MVLLKRLMMMERPSKCEVCKCNDTFYLTDEGVWTCDVCDSEMICIDD